MTTTPRRQHATAAALFVLPAALLAACGSQGSSDDKPVSVKSALVSDTAATNACRELLGDGTQIAKDLTWADTDAKDLKITGDVAHESHNRVNCKVRGKGDDDDVWITFSNSISTINGVAKGEEDYDSATTTHFVTINHDANTAMMAAEFPSQSKDALSSTFDTLVKRVQQ